MKIFNFIIRQAQDPEYIEGQFSVKSQIVVFLLFFVIFHFPFSIFHSRPARAEMLNSNSYQIQMGNVNMSAGLPTSSSYKLGLTGGQNAPGLYTSDGYKVRLGFWYIKSIIPFSFTISGLAIEFGTLSTGVPVTKTNSLTVSSGGAGGYQVTARENDLLTSSAGTATIPDTTCNGGTDTCDETNAKVWTNDAKYGFGYNMSGHDVPATFAGSTYYRPFPSSAALEDPAVVMSSAAVGRSRKATVTYKINISGSQATGQYQNYLVFVATPTY